MVKKVSRNVSIITILSIKMSFIILMTVASRFANVDKLAAAVQVTHSEFSLIVICGGFYSETMTT